MADPPGNGLTVHAPGGIKLQATGPLVIIILILVAGFLGIGYLLRETASLMERDRLLRLQEHTAILEAQNELACILALDMPDRLLALRDPRGICHYARLFDPPGRSRGR